MGERIRTPNRQFQYVSDVQGCQHLNFNFKSQYIVFEVAYIQVLFSTYYIIKATSQNCLYLITVKMASSLISIGFSCENPTYLYFACRLTASEVNSAYFRSKTSSGVKKLLQLIFFFTTLTFNLSI